MYGMTTFTKSYHYVMLDKDPRMTKPMKEVYCFLLSFQETESISQIFPSTQKIAEFTCNSERTVKRATKALQDIGLIQKTRRFNSSSIFKVMPYATKDAGATQSSVGATQSLTIGPHSPQPGATVSSYKITDKIKDKISLEEEGQNQGLSRDDDLHSPNVRIVEDDTEQKLLTEDQESKPVVIGVTPPLSDDDDYFEPDPDFDFIDDEETYLLEQRAENRNQQIQDHFSVQKPAPTPDQYQRMLGGNRVSQFKSKPSKPAWM